ncbi:GntR family transcriptional regulator [Bordetella sp. J329]|jgi:DNA-binding transcriptional MocR family regulator|uniref:aminotransferase-like domain-containing protein n=1 Tax=Kerstersia gyiorum TaxID=206506 RepID=UPI000FDBF087|nr:PLP-dependent aminotransferase family protein [Kerstersia gyiorum]AZV93178.1 GntR family transcriptional regulator [Bordetella sp. J329]MCH4272217.1 PLP-dependent aminotransferase family protein [Kerstersia gyiorum]MCI1228058.1 PLP-dependent aminotransferase family protein [Kerstersia gyiorum]
MAKPTLTEQIAAEITRQIHEGLLKAGDRLPSLRQSMKLHGHSKNTVVTAYEMLASQGLVEARHGQGFFVLDVVPPAGDDNDLQPYDRALDTIWMMRQQFVRDPGHSHLGEGFPPVAWLSGLRLDRYHRQVVRDAGLTLYRYGSRLGNMGLRQRLARRLADHAIQCTPRQVLTTFGANHALDIIIRRYLKPGDPVLVDDPGYYPLFGKLLMHGARMLGVPRQPDGPDLGVLEQLARAHRPRVFFVQTSAHNPTGSDISRARAEQILRIASKYGVLVVENDALADYKPASTVRLSALDQLRNTLYVGTFSKSVSAALRVGYIAGSLERVEELADIKMLVHTTGSEYAERVLDALLTSGQFPRQAQRLQARLRLATRRGLETLDRLGAEVFCRPEQSLYLWARFPMLEDANQLTEHCLRQGVVLAPGPIFFVDRSVPQPWTRLNVGYLDDPAFAASIRHAVQAARRP